MARKIPAKLILEYRAMGLSRNLIAKTKKVGRDSVSDVFKRADDLDLRGKLEKKCLLNIIWKK